MRKRRAVKRDVLPDALYKSKVVTKLINQIMNDGKKGTAQKIVYDAFEMIKEKTNEDAMDVFKKAMENYVKTFVGEDIFKQYLDETQPEIVDIGYTIENMYFEQNISEKVTVIKERRE